MPADPGILKSDKQQHTAALSLFCQKVQIYCFVVSMDIGFLGQAILTCTLCYDPYRITTAYVGVLFLCRCLQT